MTYFIRRKINYIILRISKDFLSKDRQIKFLQQVFQTCLYHINFTILTIVNMLQL